MPIAITDLDEGIGNSILGSGSLTSKEYINALKKHLAQDTVKFKNYRYSLADYTAVTQLEEVPAGDVHLLADLCRQAAQINPDAIVAIVANKDFLFGLSRMWEILMHEAGWDIMVFKTRDSAETWIREKAKLKFGIEDLTISGT